MHRDVQCHILQVDTGLFLSIRRSDARGASNSCAGLYGCVGHGDIAEVVLADSLEGVCVCGAKSMIRSNRSPVRSIRTDSTNEAKEYEARRYVLEEIGLASAVEGGGWAVLLVVVRRLGHAAGRISTEFSSKSYRGMRTVREAS